MARKNVIIVGASGFIGYNLLVYLKRQNVNVLGVSRSAPRWQVDAESLYRISDIADILDLNLPFNPDVIIDSSSKSTPHQLSIPGSNFDELEMLSKKVDVASRLGVNHYIYLSSGGAIYGNSTHPSSESDQLNPISEYGRLKKLSELVVNAACESHQIHSTCLRISNPYGLYHNKNQGFINVAIWKAFLGKPLEIWGNPDKICKDFIYMDDLSEAILRVIQTTPTSKVINIGSGVATSLSDILDIIRSYFPAQISIDNKNSLSSDVSKFSLDISLAKKTIGFQPSTTLDQGIQSVIDWTSSFKS